MILLYRHPALKILCFFVYFVVNHAVAGPRLHCDHPKYDFGTVIAKDEIKHEFVLMNRGDEAVKISSIKNCCGVSSSISPMEILPGSNAVCKSVFTTKNRYGKQDKQILIATNDKRKPYFELKIRGTLQRAVEYAPRMVRLGDLYSGSEIDVQIMATNMLDQAVELKSVRSTIEGIHVEQASRLPAGQGESKRDACFTLGQSWTFKLSSNGPLKEGKLVGRVQLEFSTGTVGVPVVGRVLPAIQVIPDHIKLSSSSSEVVRRLVMLRSGDGSSFEVLSAELVDVDGTTAPSKVAEGRWKCEVEVDPASIQSGSILRIKTSNEAQPLIDIPFR